MCCDSALEGDCACSCDSALEGDTGNFQQYFIHLLQCGCLPCGCDSVLEGDCACSCDSALEGDRGMPTSEKYSAVSHEKSDNPSMTKKKEEKRKKTKKREKRKRKKNYHNEI